MPPLQPSPFDEEWIECRLGGVFFLVNLGLFLGLYRDFTAPTGRGGTSLPVWELVALVAERLIGPPVRKDDPVWRLLTRLGGRVDEDARHGDVGAGDAWRLPVSWLDGFALDERWEAVLDPSRLAVMHPAGFTVLDVPASGVDPRAQLQSELEPYVDCHASCGVSMTTSDRMPLVGDGTRPSRSVDHWLDRFLPYVRARLRGALGLANEEDPAPLVLQHAATVTVTPAHLDVTYSLADLPVAIRLSGLDRDPGWVPAAGRVIRFHFI